MLGALARSVTFALMALSLDAAEPAPAPNPAGAGQLEAGASRPLPPAPPPPLPARAQATIETLRQLLAMTAEGREAFLATRTPKQQAVIRRELSILDALDTTARERRLHLLAMRVIMDPLLTLAPEAREAAVASLPADQRTFVEEQLRAWDALTPAQRDQMLATHGGWMPLPSGQAPSPKPPRVEPPAPPSPEFRSRLERDLNRWTTLDERAQTNAARALLRLFDLPPREQQAVLARLAADRRQAVQRMLAAFSELSEDARGRAVAAYWRFASMRAEERSRFWQNAERWDSLSPEERRAWRALTAHLPPLPPGLGPSPAMPPSPPEVPSSVPLRTNAQVTR